MQMAVAAYLILSPLLSLVSDFVFNSDLRAIAAASVTRQFKASGRAMTDAQINSAVDIGITVAIVFGVIFAIIFIVLAILTITRARTWVFWVDLVFLAIGVFSLISTLSSFGGGAGATVPAAARPFALVLGLADAGLVVWMVLGLVKYGPWAQEKAPATL